MTPLPYAPLLQVDHASKKNDLAKVEGLLPELQTVLGQNDIATIQLEEAVERLEIHKVLIVACRDSAWCVT